MTSPLAYDHRLCCLALFPVPVEPAPRRRNLIERTIMVSYETVRRRIVKFGRFHSPALGVSCPDATTSGISMRSSSALPERNAGSGGRWIERVVFSTRFCRRGATAGPQPVCCDACWQCRASDHRGVCNGSSPSSPPSITTLFHPAPANPPWPSTCANSVPGGAEARRLL